MCRTRPPKPLAMMSAKRRPRYSADEKRMIAKNKAKKRRDEETQHFSVIERLLRAECSPFMELQDKMILSVTLRIANVWKLSHYVISQTMKESATQSHQDFKFDKKSLIRDVSTDYIVMVLYRPCDDVESTSPFIILYVTPSVQHHIHVSNSHELFGAKFEDFCTHVEGGTYVDLRTPPSLKEKRSYPSVRYRILRSHYDRNNPNFELGFLMLQAPTCSKITNSKSGSSIESRSIESAMKIKQDSFSKYSPQFWRAMQARRSAVRRGAPKSILIPEQLSMGISGSHNVGFRKCLASGDQADVWTASAHTQEIHGSNDERSDVTNNDQICGPSNFTHGSGYVANNIMSCEGGCNRSLTELARLLNEKTSRCIDTHLLSSSGMHNQDQNLGIGTPTGALHAACTPDGGTSPSPNQSVFLSHGSGVTTPGDSFFGMNSCDEATPSPNIPTLSVEDIEDSALLTYDYNETSSPLSSPLLPENTSDEIFSNVTKVEFASTLKALSSIVPSDEGDRVDVNELVPSLGVTASESPDVVDQFCKLSVVEITNLQDIAKEQDPDSKCPCELFTCKQCLTVLENLKTEPETEPEVCGRFIKQEVIDNFQEQTDYTSSHFPGGSRVTFTADNEGEEMNQLHEFLVNSPNPPYNSTNPSHGCGCCSIDRNESTLGLRRTNPSQNLMEMTPQTSAEKMDLGSNSSMSCCRSSECRRTNLETSTCCKTNFSSGESFSAPRYIGDSSIPNQMNLYQGDISCGQSRPGPQMILSSSDVDMQGTPPHSYSQDLGELNRSSRHFFKGGITQKMSLTSITDIESEGNS